MNSQIYVPIGDVYYDSNAYHGFGEVTNPPVGYNWYQSSLSSDVANSKLVNDSWYSPENPYVQVPFHPYQVSNLNLDHLHVYTPPPTPPYHHHPAEPPPLSPPCTTDISAPKVFDKSSERKFVSGENFNTTCTTSQFTLTYHMTLSSGQPYYVVESATPTTLPCTTITHTTGIDTTAEVCSKIASPVGDLKYVNGIFDKIDGNLEELKLLMLDMQTPRRKDGTRITQGEGSKFRSTDIIEAHNLEELVNKIDLGCQTYGVADDDGVVADLKSCNVSPYITLGYVCEEISHNDLVQDEVNYVLTAVVKGMNGAEQSLQVRLAATRALNNALDFAQANFQNEMERSFIMKVVCETAMAKEAQIRRAALDIVRQGAYVMPRSQLNQVLETELSPEWSSKLTSFDYEPMAAASIGQVHRAVTKDSLDVAMKIQYPDVADGIESDIDNEKLILDYKNLLPEHMYIDRAMKVANEELSRECDYELEANNQKRFRELLSNAKGFYVLGVGNIEFVSCSPTVYQAVRMDWMRNLEVGIPALLEDGVKMLVYVGKYDLVCNWLGNSRWVHAIGWSGQKEFVASSEVTFEVDGSIGALSYVTGPEFVNYVQECYNYLTGLQSPDQVYLISADLNGYLAKMKLSSLYLDLPSSVLKADAFQFLTEATKHFLAVRYTDINKYIEEILKWPLAGIEVALFSDDLHVLSEAVAYDLVLECHCISIRSRRL